MNIPSPPFKLNETEAISALWGRLSEHYRKKLESLRTKNDTNLTEIETARLRGRIEEIKALLELTAPAIKVAD